LATLIGALILYLLTVGSVKGFALILAIASVLDLVATYFFMAPLVRLLVDRFADKPALFGIRSARNQEEVPA
ncbi:MAG: protein translocase subunit SecD, partial [Acidimicrobiaceae bacterium]|nr:protein translocase subunit SecD [Acidimicrobiaceae bacterium]